MKDREVRIKELETQNKLLRTESNGYQSAAEGHCNRVVELELEAEKQADQLTLVIGEKVELEGRIAAAIESLDSGDPDEPVWSIEGELKSILRGED